VAERDVAPAVAPTSRLTIAELFVAFMRHAERHYRGPDRQTTSEYREYCQVSRGVRALYAATPAADFGPLCLKAVRKTWVDAELARSEVNRRVNMLRRVFKWAAAEELVPFDAYHRLTAVTGLQRGRTTAPDPLPVKPVADCDVDATLPQLRPHARGLVEFIRHTGCRPGEACMIRPCDVDTSNAVWLYRPPHHKNAYRGKDRVIAIGPKARAILEPFTPSQPDAYYFTPQADVESFHAERSERRVTPLYPSHARRNVAKRTAKPKRPIGERYTTAALGRAVAAAVIRANEAHRVAIGPNLPPVAHWHPNQLRHSHATEVRRRFGLEAAQVALGHARADVTQIYAEKNSTLASEIASKMG